MREIFTSYEQVNIDFPKLAKQMISELDFRGSYELSDVNFIYYWLLAEGEPEIEMYKHTLSFMERLEYEKSKLIMEVSQILRLFLY